MASAEALDFAKLLAPISAEKPTGADPRGNTTSESLYHKLRDARKSAREKERPGSGEDANPLDWKPVQQLGTQALEEQAKDLEIAAYLIEALLRLKGFAGLRDGFRLVRELVEKFWEGLYPLPEKDPPPDEHPLAARIAPLVSLNGEEGEGTLIAPMARVPLTESSSVGPPFTLAHFNEGTSLKKITDKALLDKKLATGKVSLEMFKKAVAETQAPFYRNLVDELTACITEFTKLGEALNQRCAGHGPPTSNIRNALNKCLETVKQEAGDKWKPIPEAPKDSPKKDGAAGPGSPAGPAEMVVGILQSREQALESMRKVADFFRRTEPHSPVSYALEQVERWARMALPDLWTELIAEEAPRKSVFKQVGIRPEALTPTPPGQKPR